MGLCSLSCLVMMDASVVASFASSHGRVSPLWLIGSYTLLSIAELCVSPLGFLSSASSPPKFAGFLMGLWMAAIALGESGHRIPRNSMGTLESLDLLRTPDRAVGARDPTSVDTAPSSRPRPGSATMKSKVKPTVCCRCGAKAVFKSKGIGRTIPYYRTLPALALPCDLVIANCKRCKSLFVEQSESPELRRRLQMLYVKSLQRRTERRWMS